MKKLVFIWAVAMIVILALPSLVKAAIPAVYTNENFWSSEHDRPAHFTRDAAGNFFGTTETGKNFSQTVVENTLSVRLMKFSIDEAYFYVSDKGIIKASTDIAALSIYLTTEV